jgi:hypothetical protein
MIDEDRAEEYREIERIAKYEAAQARRRADRPVMPWDEPERNDEGSTMEQSALVTALAELAQRREFAARLKASVDEARAKFAAGYAREIEDAKAAAAFVDDAERTVRALAVSEYEAGAALPGGVSVIEKKVVTIDDAKALEFAKASKVGYVAETFDRKALEKLARSTEVPYATVTEEPDTRIASDLSGYLPAVAS